MVRVVRGIREQHSLGRALLQRWPFLLACALFSVLCTAVILLARPSTYEAQATVLFDAKRYDFAIQETAGRLTLNPALDAAARDLLALAFPADLQASAAVAEPLEFRVGDAQTLVAIGRATSAARAAEIAAHGGAALSDSLSSIRGWNLLRTLLRRAVALQGQGRPEPPSPLTPYLFVLLDNGLLSYDPTIPLTPEPPALNAQDVADITLALQRQDSRQSARINTLFALKERTSDASKVGAIEAELAGLTAQREQVRKALLVLYRQQDALATSQNGAMPTAVSAARPLEQSGGATRWLFLAVGAGAGLFLGAVLVYSDETAGLGLRVREVWTYRDLIWNLVLRDLKARYKNSVLGYLWSLINPLLMMGVFTVLFKVLLNNPIPNFPVFLIVALLPWNFAATTVSGSVVSITGQSALIKKVYFPREAIPIALVIANLINYLLALPAMIAIMLVLNAHFQPVALIFPVIVFIEAIFLLGLAFFLASLNVFFRDTQVIMEVLLTAWFFLTPIFYRLDDIVPRWSRLVRWLNPMASLIDFYRDIFYQGGMPAWDAVIRTLVTALLILVVGYLFFLRLSPRFGEEL